SEPLEHRLWLRPSSLPLRPCLRQCSMTTKNCCRASECQTPELSPCCRPPQTESGRAQRPMPCSRTSSVSQPLLGPSQITAVLLTVGGLHSLGYHCDNRGKKTTVKSPAKAMTGLDTGVKIHRCTNYKRSVWSNIVTANSGAEKENNRIEKRNFFPSEPWLRKQYTKTNKLHLNKLTSYSSMLYNLDFHEQVSRLKLSVFYSITH
uniref:Uncharacterized protein n=1 Tax=Cynoglossus semilaevis TaxID=244447 RepID=A0A3P8VYD5_CYNSE